MVSIHLHVELGGGVRTGPALAGPFYGDLDGAPFEEFAGRGDAALEGPRRRPRPRSPAKEMG
ncbi:MAG: hypothetical protein MZV64_16670 [Ignavibacteriales bacterium]|nr:hypothetical protein [Ignavibacteriales bacterium]